MFFPDCVQAYREARRVLREGGYYFLNVWDRISDNEFADTITQVLAALYPTDPPRFLARTPHGYHDIDKIRADLTAAGFTEISIDTIEKGSKAATPKDAAIAYCHGTPLRNEIEARDSSGLDRATEAATEALVRRFGSGPVEGRIQAHTISARR